MPPEAVPRLLTAAKSIAPLRGLTMVPLLVCACMCLSERVCVCESTCVRCAVCNHYYLSSPGPFDSFIFSLNFESISSAMESMSFSDSGKLEVAGVSPRAACVSALPPVVSVTGNSPLSLLDPGLEVSLVVGGEGSSSAIPPKV